MKDKSGRVKERLLSSGKRESASVTVITWNVWERQRDSAGSERMCWRASFRVVVVHKAQKRENEAMSFLTRKMNTLLLTKEFGPNVHEHTLLLLCKYYPKFSFYRFTVKWASNEACDHFELANWMHLYISYYPNLIDVFVRMSFLTCVYAHFWVKETSVSWHF